MLPVDTLDGAADYFTFGGDSVGMWIVLILAILAFVYFIVHTISMENHNHGHSLTEEDMTPSPFTLPHGSE